MSNILVVDDVVDNLRFLSQTLSSQGYKVRGAKNGAAALKVVKKIVPDLILLDIRMPDLNGYEICQRLKADAITKDIPIIFLSALDDVLDKVQAFEAGAVDYVTKPFDLQTHGRLVRSDNSCRLSLLDSMGNRCPLPSSLIVNHTCTIKTLMLKTNPHYSTCTCTMLQCPCSDY